MFLRTVKQKLSGIDRINWVNISGRVVSIVVNGRILKPFKLNNRAGGIRTHDLLNPIQAFYQAELRPDSLQTIDQLQRNRHS